MGKGGETKTAMAAADAPAEDANEVLINGELYDVSSFRHPGGSIVKFLKGGGDATEAFTEFHGRSKKANAMLKAMPSRAAPSDVMARRAHNGGARRAALSKDYALLRDELKSEGFFDPSPSEVAYRISEVVGMHALGLWLLAGRAGTGVDWFLGLVVLGVVSGRCGWLMHEGGHYSLTGQIKIDRALQVALYGVGCGMSAAWWRNQHNKHHATPQKLKHDVDLDTLPLIAFHSKVAAKAKGAAMRGWLKLQGVLFVPVSCVLVATGWQFYLHPRHMVRAKLYGEMAALTVRLVGIFGLVLRDYTWAQAIGTYCLYNQIAASYIFTNFSLSHTHLPVTESDEFVHWVEYASNHTTNLAPGLVCNWWMAYLNFQIEHHLFPSMPQFRHKLVSPRVQKLFAKHGLRYDVRPYFSCLGETLLNLHNVGNEAHDHHPAEKKAN